VLVEGETRIELVVAPVFQLYWAAPEHENETLAPLQIVKLTGQLSNGDLWAT
jgi:hypothetical protein